MTCCLLCNKKSSNVLCDNCSSLFQKAEMVVTGKTKLYDTGGMHLSNYSNTLHFDIIGSQRGNHNIAPCRIDFWFNGPDNHTWHGILYGNNTCVVHCKRNKSG